MKQDPNIATKSVTASFKLTSLDVLGPCVLQEQQRKIIKIVYIVVNPTTKYFDFATFIPELGLHDHSEK